MTLATPGFQGDRLREAREARGISQVDLARLIDVTRQAVSSFEKGTNSPAPATTRKIADVLGLKPAFFQREEPLGSSLPAAGPTYFRSFARARAGDRRKGEFRLNLVAELVAISMAEIEYPEVALPEIYLGSNPELIDEPFIERLAISLRKHWRLGSGPIQNVVWLLENNGVVVVLDDVATNDIDAFSCWRAEVPIIILGSNKRSAVRSRWDAAHELGHLILHRNVDQHRLADKEGLAMTEAQANFFAQCFLMPREGYERAIIVPSLDEFLVAKPKWKVSVQAQIERSFKLKLIGESSRTRMWRQLNRQGWATREPYDDEIPMEEPVLVRKAFEMALEDHSIDLEWLEATTGHPAEVVLALVKAKPSHFDEPVPANVVSLTSVRRHTQD